MELVFATNNTNKLKEINDLLPQSLKVKGLSHFNFFDDIPETGKTLAENALQKSQCINQKFNVNCFSDDTGLEIDALDGEPGVFSARYAGEEKNSLNNMNLVLDKMIGITNRKARFRTVISLILDGKEYFFEGCVEGVIENEPKGTKGFGYDPIFTPDGYDYTFAELELDEKNKISHRAIAFNKLIAFLKAFE